MKYERITKPIDEDNFGGLPEIEITRKLYRAYSKLVKIEDIEEKLGIDFVTLFKALKSGVYFEKDKKHHIVALDLGSSGNYRLSYEIIDGLFESVYAKDYGKTWALTKEELK